MFLECLGNFWFASAISTKFGFKKICCHFFNLKKLKKIPGWKDPSGKEIAKSFNEKNPCTGQNWKKAPQKWKYCYKMLPIDLLNFYFGWLPMILQKSFFNLILLKNRIKCNI